jgi:site-specific DNA-methyltransferase (adenine-specific)
MQAIRNENCLETMSGMKDKSVDIVITSPPYNMNLRINNGKYCSRQIVREISTKYNEFEDNIPIEEFEKIHSEILQELIRVSELVFYNIAVVTGSKRAFFKMIGRFSDELKEIIVWDKGYGQPAMHDGVLNRQSELILVFGGDAISRYFAQSTFNRGGLSDIWKIQRKIGKIDNHGATFPEELVFNILNNFTKEGQLVYDPFSGSGTVGAVSKMMGRRFIGSEINTNYCEAANDRIQGILL